MLEVTSWHAPNNNLSQIYSSGLEYSFVNQKGEQCEEFKMCKDWLQDAVWATVHQTPASIYGFKFDPSSNPAIDMDNTRLLMTNAKDKDFLKKIDNMLDFINQVEDIIGLQKTTVKLVSNPPTKYKACGVIETSSSARWMRSPAMLSLYTLFLRVGFAHKIGDNWQKTVKDMIKGNIPQYQHNDQGYLSRSVEGIKYIIKAGYKNIFYNQMKFNYPEKIDINTLHNNSGIVAFSNSLTGGTKIVKHWYREELQEIIKASTVELDLA